MKSMPQALRLTPEIPCSTALVPASRTAGWDQPAGIAARKAASTNGRTVIAHYTPTSGIRGQRPTSSLDRWTG